jgi:hypothetical protein
VVIVEGERQRLSKLTFDFAAAPPHLASREFAVANRPDTRFNLGSINKLFTQVALGQLLDQESRVLQWLQN